jgi:hypothetical protein
MNIGMSAHRFSVQPVTGFHILSFHSIALFSDMTIKPRNRPARHVIATANLRKRFLAVIAAADDAIPYH